MNNILIPPQQRSNATQFDGLDLCKKLYEVLLPLGFYPALTGGLLYKSGNRKDIDIVIFRNRQAHKHFELEDLTIAFRAIGMTEFRHCGFVTKCEYDGLNVDLFNPESLGSDTYESTS